MQRVDEVGDYRFFGGCSPVTTIEGDIVKPAGDCRDKGIPSGNKYAVLAANFFCPPVMFRSILY
ncbi:MAG: hypothetical protein HGA27_07945 [Peptococcaceae bacterium]|nr:hypothetical protein [Peptococcaceae bacterium]